MASADSEPSDLDVYRLVRSQIEFEDGLTTQRLSWFVTAQAFLFSAYAITLNAPVQPATTSFGAQSRLLYRLIPVVAVAACVLIYLAILSGVAAQLRLRRFLARHVSSARLGVLPLVQGYRDTRILGLAAPLGLPLVFVGVWVALFIRGFS